LLPRQTLRLVHSHDGADDYDDDYDDDYEDDDEEDDDDDDDDDHDYEDDDDSRSFSSILFLKAIFIDHLRIGQRSQFHALLTSIQ
jgi:hypothetical protein